jgi:hypothetical protein
MLGAIKSLFKPAARQDGCPAVHQADMKEWIKSLVSRTAAPKAEDVSADFKRSINSHSGELIAKLISADEEHRLIETDYPYSPRPRPYSESSGGKRIIALLEQADETSRKWLAEAAQYIDHFRMIPPHADPTGTAPAWINDMLPGLDGMMLYTLVRSLRPRVYLEVGSGNSTKFVRRAIQDGALSTKIISIDPHPRAEVDVLCDEIIRKPFEDVHESTYLDLMSAGDMMFIDNSHRSFTNSDVTVFFTETISALPSGIYYGIHDICLPYDYPEEWNERFYNEQYLLASYLLGGGGGDEIIFPGIYVSNAPQFSRPIASLFDAPEFHGVARHAGAFWMRRSD